ncbi:MAG: nitroreductase family protein [Kiritimatiellae bacterium]|nr:nitroreductase family protein [Kiritimatiellia bacterium]MDD5520637.1 nitroreductase family protein [Kiritimatiellia bacterium]
MKSFLELVNRRISCRAYKPDPIPKEMIENILEAARLAPSACNRQPWRFSVITESNKRKTLAEKGILPGLGMQWIAEAPVILVLGIKKSFITHSVATTISGVDYPLLDIGIAGEHAILQATEMGLGTCWIGWIKPGTIRRIVDWPADITPQAMITIGWPAAPMERISSRLSKDEIVKWQ